MRPAYCTQNMGIAPVPSPAEACSVKKWRLFAAVGVGLVALAFCYPCDWVAGDRQIPWWPPWSPLPWTVHGTVAEMVEAMGGFSQGWASWPADSGGRQPSSQQAAGPPLLRLCRTGNHHYYHPPDSSTGLRNPCGITYGQRWVSWWALM